MKSIIWKIIRRLNLGILLLAVHPKSAIITTGWIKSFRSRSVIDQNNEPIPWWTYSFIDFIKDKLKKNLRILEFGSGFSTIWLSFRVQEVVAMEDHAGWAEKTRQRINKNSTILEVPSIVDYDYYKEKITGLFDILIIDNRGDRIDCARRNLNKLNDGGVVIWDNTDGKDWLQIKEIMALKSFKEISFTGMTAQELKLSKTTLFYRAANCLDI
jgi:hypothetical protein